MGKIFDETLGIFRDISSNPEVKVELPSILELEKKLDEIYPKRSQTNPPNSSSGTTSEATVPKTTSASPTVQEVATSIKRGCLPCSVGHFVTCTGLLNEAMRFARKDGLASDQVIEDVNTCLAELNAMERVDLQPSKMAGLPGWEKDLAIEALELSRQTRHTLESLTSVEDLEKVAAGLQPAQLAIAKKWARAKLGSLPPADHEKLVSQAKR